MSGEFAIAPGLAWALGQVEDDSNSGGPRRRGPDPPIRSLRGRSGHHRHHRRLCDLAGAFVDAAHGSPAYGCGAR